jgi:hypothetical protein
MNYRGDQVELCSMASNQYSFDEQLKLNGLNLEARLGRDATEKYLYLMAQDFYEYRQIYYDNTQRRLLALRLN